MGYVIGGRCQTVVLDPSGQTEINNYGPGDLWFFPKGHGHSIQTIGDEPCHFILSFDNGAFSEHGTFSITDWVDVTPKDMLATNFGLPAEAFAPFPKGETYNPGRASAPRIASYRRSLAEGVYAQIPPSRGCPGAARFRRRHLQPCHRR